MSDVIIVLNPGSTSTKLGLFTRDGRLDEQTVRHDAAEIGALPSAFDQLELRLATIRPAVARWLAGARLVAVVGRGGLLRSCSGGIFAVGDAMEADLREARYGNHASNLGATLARAVAAPYGAPSFVADPVTTDEFVPEARLSGLPEIVRRSRAHALNMKASARRAATELGRSVGECDFVVAHLGGGISVGAVRGGAIIDVNDALLGMGPFSPERAGALPIGPLVELATSGRYTRAQLLDRLSREAGLKAYTGTNDVAVVLERVAAGDEAAGLAYRAMIHQIAKEVGAMAAVLRGRLDGIVVTGGIAHGARVVSDLTDYVGFLGRVFVYPGENELESLAAAGFRAVDGTEPVKTYERE